MILRSQESTDRFSWFTRIWFSSSRVSEIWSDIRIYRETPMRTLAARAVTVKYMKIL